MHVVTQVELYVHASNTRAFDIFGRRFILMRFRSYTPTGYMYVFVLIYCQKRFQIADAFSMKTLGALVWTEGLSASKCIRFKTKTP